MVPPPARAAGPPGAGCFMDQPKGDLQTMTRFLLAAGALAVILGGAAGAQAQDVKAGEKVFAKCKACHTVEEGGKNRVGPNLFGVFGKPVGTNQPDFKYSKALVALGEEGQVWTPELLDAWLANPKGVITKTKMIFPGLKKPDDRTNVIAYIQQFGG